MGRDQNPLAQERIETAVWNSPNLTTGGRFSHTFATTGSFGYYCAVHPYMLGKIVAQ